MDLPDFELGLLELEEAHESEPRVAPASARVQVGEDWFLLRAARGKDGNPRLFLRLDELNAPVLVAKVYFTPKSVTELTLKNIFVELQKPEPIGLSLLTDKLPWNRHFKIEASFEGEETSVILILGRHPEWRICFGWQDAYPSQVGHFDWQKTTSKSQQWLFRASNQEVLSEVEQWLNDSQSECAFALRWAQMARRNNNDRMRSVIEFQHGKLDDFERVLRWISWDQDALWNLGNHVDWMIQVEQNSISFEVRGVVVRRSSDYGLEIDDRFINTSQWPTRLNLCIDILHAYFCPVYKDEMLRYHDIYWIWKAGVFNLFLSIERPSQHERLEARLRLREWLVDKVAPGEIPALLGEA